MADEKKEVAETISKPATAALMPAWIVSFGPQVAPSHVSHSPVHASLPVVPLT